MGKKKCSRVSLISSFARRTSSSISSGGMPIFLKSFQPKPRRALWEFVICHRPSSLNLGSFGHGFPVPNNNLWLASFRLSRKSHTEPRSTGKPHLVSDQLLPRHRQTRPRLTSAYNFRVYQNHDQYSGQLAKLAARTSIYVSHPPSRLCKEV